MKVLFAPDWRKGVPYQTLLAEALAPVGVEVAFLADYKRLLPLSRLVKDRTFDVLHLHWPEAYYPRRQDGFDWFRKTRFTTDLARAVRAHPLVFTAHNLAPHNRAGEFRGERNMHAVFTTAHGIIAHSAAARDCILETHGLAPERVHVIPHGDLSPSLGTPIPRMEAVQQLGLPPGRICLMFGTVEPYKQIEEVIAYWRTARPEVTLAIVGKPSDPAYAAYCRQLTAGLENVTLRLEWLPDEQLRLWLSAADAAVFNYRTIFTSGAASLARSWGVPILIPHRLRTVDLGEPNARVHRFESFATDFASALGAALKTPADFSAAADWRAATAWPHLARATLEVYSKALDEARSANNPKPCAA
jgi:glycosyltransferase involved in cell wall biosynthesis